jgi:hypothetical protein
MKKVICFFFLTNAICLSAQAYVGNINCKDKSGKVRISFHVDTTRTDQVPQCVTQVKFDGEVVTATIGAFPDDGPIFEGKNAAGQLYSAQFQHELSSSMFGYTTEAVVKGVETTLRCR